MKKISLITLSCAFLFASDLPDFIKGTFLEKSLKNNKNIEFKFKKINNNIILINLIDKNKKRIVPLYEDINTKSFFVGKMIKKDGLVINSIIINKNEIKKAIAFTFGKGDKEIYIFTDPECPYCRIMEKHIGDKLAKNYKVYVILYPLPFHKNAKQMTMYILAGKTNNKKVERFKNVLNGNDTNWQNFQPNRKDLEEYNKYMKNVENAVILLGVNGTPSVYDENFNIINWENLK